MNYRLRLLFVSGAILVAAAPSFGQVTNYYLTEGTSGVGATHVWQGGAEAFNYAWAAAGEMPIVVGDFGSGLRVRQAVGQPLSGHPEQGDEYMANGAATGFHNMWDSSNSSTITGYDAAFDGSSIFMLDWNGATDGGVYRYDNNYNNRTFMFQANVHDIGITYDSGTQTIWTAGFVSGLVQQWTLAGAPLASFTAASRSAAALAYDSLMAPSGCRTAAVPTCCSITRETVP